MKINDIIVDILLFCTIFIFFFEVTKGYFKFGAGLSWDYSSIRRFCVLIPLSFLVCLAVSEETFSSFGIY